MSVKRILVFVAYAAVVVPAGLALAGTFGPWAKLIVGIPVALFTLIAIPGGIVAWTRAGRGFVREFRRGWGGTREAAR